MAVPAPGSVRSFKKNQTRRALLDAADQLFERKGYEATTLDEICEKAGISLRTFFRYFESKRDLALYENVRNMMRLREVVAGASSPAAVVGELETLYDFMAMEFEEDPKARRRLFRMIKEGELAGRSLTIDLDTEVRIGQALSQGQAESAANDAQLVAIMLVGGVRRAVSAWAESQGKGSLRDAIATVFSAVRRSHLVPAPRR